MGNPDWDAAVRDGLLDPLPSIDPGVPGEPPLLLDVLFNPNLSGLEVVFSHETHTYWLTCDGCHPSITVMQAGANPITMEKIFDGEYCGRCHGTVAFAVESDCSRCHDRVAIDGIRPANYQPAVVFRHWKHRMHFRCSACHPGIFEMRAGANEITMDALLTGESCGRCHDGLRAFGVAFETCTDCHSHEVP
jgi:c(7)-type cytochrome triheme protein